MPCPGLGLTLAQNGAGNADSIFPQPFTADSTGSDAETNLVGPFHNQVSSMLEPNVTVNEDPNCDAVNVASCEG